MATTHRLLLLAAAASVQVGAAPGVRGAARGVTQQCALVNVAGSSHLPPCNGRGLTEIPPLPHRVKHVDLGNNHITSLLPDRRALARGRRDWTSPCDQTNYAHGTASIAAGKRSASTHDCAWGRGGVRVRV